MTINKIIVTLTTRGWRVVEKGSINDVPEKSIGRKYKLNTPLTKVNEYPGIYMYYAYYLPGDDLAIRTLLMNHIKNRFTKDMELMRSIGATIND